MKLPMMASSLILGIGLMGASVAQAEQGAEQKQAEQPVKQASTSMAAAQS